MSWSGQCQDCGNRALTENLRSLTTHSGPAFQHWRRRGAASYGAVLVDDLMDEG